MKRLKIMMCMILAAVMAFPFGTALAKGRTGDYASPGSAEQPCNDNEFRYFNPYFTTVHGEELSGFFDETYPGQCVGENIEETYGCDQYVVVNCDDWVSMRKESDSGSERILTVDKGSWVDVLGTGNGWSLCEVSGRYGWIESYYLSKNGSASHGGDRDTDTHHREPDSRSMVFSADERYRASYYLSNFGEQCRAGRSWWLEDYDSYTGINAEVIESMIIYAYINQSDSVRSEDNGFSSIAKDKMRSLIKRHFGTRSVNFDRFDSLTDDFFYCSGNRVYFDTGEAKNTSNNFCTIVTSSAYDGDNYDVEFNIYRASSGYWKSCGYWFDKSVYRMTKNEIESNGNFEKVAAGRATLAPYTTDGGTHTYSVEYYSIESDWL